MEDKIGKPSWYMEEGTSYCEWRDMECNVHLRVRPTPVCFMCVIQNYLAEICDKLGRSY